MFILFFLVPNYLPLLGDNNIAGTLQTLQTSSKAHGMLLEIIYFMLVFFEI